MYVFSIEKESINQSIIKELSFLFLFLAREFFHVLLTRLMLLLGTIKGSPNGLPNKETHRMNETIFIASETMVNAFGQRHEIPLFDVHAHPLVLQGANIKVSRSSDNVTNLFRVVNVLFKESFDFL
jgi:hypothetical protein